MRTSQNLATNAFLLWLFKTLWFRLKPWKLSTAGEIVIISYTTLFFSFKKSVNYFFKF